MKAQNYNSWKFGLKNEIEDRLRSMIFFRKTAAFLTHTMYFFGIRRSGIRQNGRTPTPHASLSRLQSRAYTNLLWPDVLLFHTSQQFTRSLHEFLAFHPLAPRFLPLPCWDRSMSNMKLIQFTFDVTAVADVGPMRWIILPVVIGYARVVWYTLAAYLATPILNSNFLQS